MRLVLGLRTTLTLVCLVAIGSPDADAAGFFIMEQSVRGMGVAYAGHAAADEDASTIFYNPAGLTQLEGPEVQAGLSLLLLSATIDNTGSSAYTVATAGVPVGVQGANSDIRNSAAAVPNFYAAHPLLDEKLWLGFALTAPFGLQLTYDETWFGRYDSTDSKLRTYDLAPTVAWAPLHWISLGLSLNVQYAQASVQSKLPDPTTPGGPNYLTDGNLYVRGDSWAAGFTMGILLEPTSSTRVGASYRYGIEHDLEGVASIGDFQGAVGAQENGTWNSSAEFDLPDVVMVGLAQEVGDDLTLLAEFHWTEWSSFDELRVVRGGGLPDLVEEANWRDTISVSVGAEYRLGEAWAVRSGFMYDESPVTSATRGTRVPDGNRYWLSFGASWRMWHPLWLDVSYSHLFIPNGSINRTLSIPTPFVPTTVNTVGEVVASIDVLGFQLRYGF